MWNHTGPIRGPRRDREIRLGRFLDVHHVNAFLSPLNTASSLASNYQFYLVDQKVAAVHQLLSGLQSLQIANLALAGLGIGMSVAASHCR